METPFIRKYYLSEVGNRDGVSCDERGAFVGAVPLLRSILSKDGERIWEPRDPSELNLSLGICYGLPVDITGKQGGLEIIADALNHRNLVKAKIATVQLALPDPVPQAASIGETSELAILLRSGGMLKASTDDPKHPGWPAGTSGSRGGQFRPRNGDESGSVPVLPIADFSGGFHDAVIDAWMEFFRKQGIPAVRTPGVRIIGGDGKIVGYPDMIVHETGHPIEVWEVKTGDDPPFTDNQRAYLPVFQIGGHIYSTDPKIRALGVEPGVPFPPVEVYIIFAPAPNEQYKIIKLPPPIIVP